MPQVGGRRFAYTKKGVAQAKRAAARTGQPMRSAPMPQDRAQGGPGALPIPSMTPANLRGPVGAPPMRRMAKGGKVLAKVRKLYGG